MVTPISNPASLAPALPLEPVAQQPAEITQEQKNWDALARSLPRLGGVATSIFVGLGGLGRLGRRVGLVRPVGMVRPMVLGTIVGGTVELGLLMLERQRKDSVYANHSWLDLAKLAFWDDAFSATLNLAIGRFIGVNVGVTNPIARGVLVNEVIGLVQALKSLDTSYGIEDVAIAGVSGFIGGAWAPVLQQRWKTELAFEIGREFCESLAQIKFDRQSPGKLTTDVMIESLVMSFSEVGGSLAGHRGGVRVKTLQPATTITQFQPQFAASVKTTASERSPVITSSQLDPPLAKFAANFRAQYRLHKLFADKDVSDPRQVLFVCTGNTHRSAAMQLTLEQLAEDKKGRKLQVRSAGLMAVEETLDPVIADLAELHGINKTRIDNFRPSTLNDDLVAEADVIICAGENHRTQLARIYPEAASKLFLFHELAPEAALDHRLSMRDPIGSQDQTVEVFEDIQVGMRDEVWPLIGKKKSRLFPSPKRAQTIKDQLPETWTDQERDLFVYMMVVRNGGLTTHIIEDYLYTVRSLTGKWSARHIIDFCVLGKKSQYHPEKDTGYTFNIDHQYDFGEFSDIFSPAELMHLILADEQRKGWPVRLVYHDLPKNWSHELRYKICLFLRRDAVIKDSVRLSRTHEKLLDNIDHLIEQSYFDDAERDQILAYLKERKLADPADISPVPDSIAQGRYHAALLAARDLGFAGLYHTLKFERDLPHLVEQKCWLRALHCMDYLKAVGQEVDADLEAKVQQQAEIQKRAIAHHKPRRVLPRAIDVKSEIITFYAMQAIQTRLEQVETYQLDDQAQQQITELRRQMALRQQDIIRWVREYLVFAVEHELRNAPAGHKPDDYKVNVPLYGRGFLDRENFLTHALPADVRWFLAQAQTTFVTGVWRSAYGGRRWQAIAECAQELWNGQETKTATLDRIFNLAHNTNTAFDKLPTIVRPEKVTDALNFKKVAANLETLLATSQALDIEDSVANTLHAWQARLKTIEDHVGVVPDSQVGLVSPIIEGFTTPAIGEVQWMVGRLRFKARCLQPGEILVCNKITPEIYPHLAKASGVIATEGNLLSHAMIIRREYGIPAVILPEMEAGFNLLKMRKGGKGVLVGGSRTVRLHAQGGIAVLADESPFETDSAYSHFYLQDFLFGHEGTGAWLELCHQDSQVDLQGPATQLIENCLDTMDQLLRHPRLSPAYIVKRARELMAGIQRIAPYADFDDTVLQQYDDLIAARTPKPQSAPTQPATAPLPTLATPLDQIGLEHTAHVGAKAATLGYLQNQGVDAVIPNGVSLSVDVFERYLDQSGIRGVFDNLNQVLAQALDQNHNSAIKETSRAIRELIETNPLTYQPSLPNEINTVLDSQGWTAATHLAIRSSAVCEDLPTISHAGLASTQLNVHGVRRLTAITQVWASFWGESAVRYRHQQGLNPKQVSPAVILQEMVDADASGVLFTRNPINSRDEIVMTLGEGFGRGVESESVDQITVSTRDQIHFDTPPIITEDQVLRLALLARDVRDKLGYDVDIEYAVKGDQIYLLQARPITAVG